MKNTELFGEMHEQEENGLYGRKHAELCFLQNVSCCDCKADLDEMEQEENKKVTDNKDEYRCYYCFRQNAIDNDEIGWL